MKRSLVAFLLLLLSSQGCSNDAGPAEVKGYDAYSDPLLNFAIRYPKGWPNATESGTAIFYSSPTLADAFARYEPGDQTGAKVEVRALLGGEQGMKQSIDSLIGQFTDKGLFKTDQSQIAGGTATRLTYGFPVGETEFKAERYYVVKGNVVTYIETAVFGDYGAYSTIFDSVRSSFKPGEVAATAPTGSDSGGAVVQTDLVSPPAADVKGYSGSHFSLNYPTNFNQMTSSGGKLASVRFIGDRVDSYIQVDVNTSENELQEHANEIKAKFGAGRATTLGGSPAMVFNFKGGPSVSGRIYLAKSGSKLYQVTVTWFTAQAESYLPAFDKVIASFKAK